MSRADFGEVNPPTVGGGGLDQLKYDRSTQGRIGQQEETSKNSKLGLNSTHQETESCGWVLVTRPLRSDAGDEDMDISFVSPSVSEPGSPRSERVLKEENEEERDKIAALEQEVGRLRNEAEGLRSELWGVQATRRRSPRKPIINQIPGSNPIRAIREEAKGPCAQQESLIDNLYQAVLHISNLSEVTCSGWALEIARGFDLSCSRAIPVAVLGGSDKGKTWLLTRLANHLALPNGVVTEGISLRLAKLQDGRDVMLIDTAGKGKAISNWNREKSEEAKAKETFVMDVAYYMAQVYIYVVEVMEEQEQDKLNDLLQRIRLNKGPTPVVVVHNLKNITSLEDWQKQVEHLISLFKTSEEEWDYVRGVRVPAFGGDEGCINYLDGPLQRHFFLGCDGYPSGSTNKFVFKSIMDYIGSQGSGSPTKSEENLLNSINLCINAHLPTCGSVQLEKEMQAGSKSVRRVTWRGADTGRVVKRQPTPLVDPRLEEAPMEVFELQDNRLAVQIAAPGVVREHVKVRVVREEGGVTLVVSGTRNPEYYQLGHEHVRLVRQSNLKHLMRWKVNVDLPGDVLVPNSKVVKQNMHMADGMLTFCFEKIKEEC